MTERPRDPAELIVLLNEQMGFMDTSAERYDAGDMSEHARLAVSIRVLLHDRGPGVALLTQIGLKQKLKYLNTAHPIDAQNLLTQQGLVTIKVSGPDAAGYDAPLGMERPPTRVPVPQNLGFGQWWRYPVVKDEHGEEFTREDLVLRVSNKEGGAHVDENLPSDWYALTRENSSAWTMLPSDIPLGSPVPASVRQIAYELRETIRTQIDGTS